MHTNINILDKDYLAWVNDLIHRYKASQIKAAVRVNREVLQFYWSVVKNFYVLFNNCSSITPQPVEQITTGWENLTPQVVEQLGVDIFAVPWGHYRYIIDRYLREPKKALFFVRKTLQEGWSRAMLLNFIDTDLYERGGGRH